MQRTAGEPEVLRTARLLLRPHEARDRDAWRAIHRDPEVMAYLGGPMPRGASDRAVQRWSEQLAAQGWGLWALERLDDGQLVGFTGLSRPSFDAHFTPCLEVAWRLGRAHWGQGYATEAASAALDHAFQRLGATEVVAFTAEGNLRSRRVMERLGMTRDATDDFDHPRLAPTDSLRRHVLYRLTRAAWRRAATREAARP